MGVAVFPMKATQGPALLQSHIRQDGKKNLYEALETLWEEDTSCLDWILGNL